MWGRSSWLWLNSSLVPSLLSCSYLRDQARVCEVSVLPAGSKRLYSFLLFDLVHGQMALLHACTFRWRRYELQAVLLYFCNWALIRDSLIWDRRSSASGIEEEFNSCLPAFQPNTFITRLEVKPGQLGSSCFGQGLVQVFLTKELFHTNKNTTNKFTSCFFFLHCCLTGFLFAPFWLCPCSHVWDCGFVQWLFKPSSDVLCAAINLCLSVWETQLEGHWALQVWGWETSGLWITVGQRRGCPSAPQQKDLDSSSNAPNC